MAEPTKPRLTQDQISDKITVPEALRVAWANYCTQYADLMELVESIPERGWGFGRYKRWRTIVGPRHKKSIEDLSTAIRNHMSEQENIVYHNENINESIRQLNDTTSMLVEALRAVADNQHRDLEAIHKVQELILNALVKLGNDKKS